MCSGKLIGYLGFFCRGVFIGEGASSEVVTTQDFIKFWGKIFAFVLLEKIGISQGFKTFEFIWKLY
jgi:hypothetical protein